MGTVDLNISFFEGENSVKCCLYCVVFMSTCENCQGQRRIKIISGMTADRNDKNCMASPEYKVLCDFLAVKMSGPL